MSVSESSDGRLLLRFAIGATSLIRERLIFELRAGATATGQAARLPRLRHQLIGGLLVLPPRLAGALQSAWVTWQGKSSRFTRSAHRIVQRSGRWRHLEDQLHRMRSQLALELEHWGAIGQAEEDMGRALTKEMTARVYAEVFANLGANRDIQELIQEHSAGLTRGVIDELRERSANADSRVESLVHRLRREH